MGQLMGNNAEIGTWLEIRSTQFVLYRQNDLGHGI